MKLIILSGLSGAGKSIALHMLEDLGYYCTDNIPAGLLRDFVDQTIRTGEPMFSRTAVGVDARNPSSDIATIPGIVQEICELELNCELIFLQADTDVLIKRYSETRRRHPLSDDRVGLREAIKAERSLLSTICEAADLVIDTTRTTVHELRDLVRKRIDQRGEGRLSLLFQSFGYKHGIPSDADFVFDVRCLPNPYWEPTLRRHNGQDVAVIEFLESHSVVEEMIRDIRGLIERWLPQFQESNRSYLTIAIGCTGGQHRSVYVADQLAGFFQSKINDVMTRHNEIGSKTVDLFSAANSD